MKRLGILDCDELAPELVDDFTHYTRMFQDMLGPLLGDVVVRRYAILDGDWPEEPDACSAYLVTGSKTGVYDDADWLGPLRRFLQDCFQRGIPLAGVCFGHQMLAHSLGGRAGKSDKGWGLGAYTTRINDDARAYFDKMPEALTLLYSHQDQVEQLPEGSVCLYGNEFCPNAAFYIPDKVLAFQGHPEFSREYSKRLMTLRLARYAPGQYEQAMSTLDTPLDADWVAQLMARFIVNASLGQGEQQ